VDRRKGEEHRLSLKSIYKYYYIREKSTGSPLTYSSIILDWKKIR